MSFELGVPVHEIDTWPAHTIKRYEDYAMRHLLPSQVAHLYWAQIPYMAVKLAGGNEQLTLNDFTIRLHAQAKQPASAEDEQAANDAVWDKLRQRGRKRRA